MLFEGQPFYSKDVRTSSGTVHLKPGSGGRENSNKECKDCAGPPKHLLENLQPPIGTMWLTWHCAEGTIAKSSWEFGGAVSPPTGPEQRPGGVQGTKSRKL